MMSLKSWKSPWNMKILCQKTNMRQLGPLPPHELKKALLPRLSHQRGGHDQPQETFSLLLPMPTLRDVFGGFTPSACTDNKLNSEETSYLQFCFAPRARVHIMKSLTCDLLAS
jgi:hypothetical protein